jgi:hypothetical protein
MAAVSRYSTCDNNFKFYSSPDNGQHVFVQRLQLGNLNLATPNSTNTSPQPRINLGISIQILLPNLNHGAWPQK